jgi:SIR2-like domain
MPRTKSTPQRAIARSPQEELIIATTGGGITLVVGAGVSTPRGIPNWDSLARSVWNEVFGEKPSPWAVLEGVRSAQQLPQFLPIVFELAYRELEEEKFIQVLRQKLYANVTHPLEESGFIRSKESLAVIARTIKQERRREGRRRITGVITLNADDLIEQAVCKVAGTTSVSSQDQVVVTIARSTHQMLARLRRNPIPIYHIHGFLPSGLLQMRSGHYEHMMVFTDSQYWLTSTSGFSLPNRVMASALLEGRCVFIGLSMTDINLLRWLALRSLERDRDLSETVRHLERPTRVKSTMDLQFNRHFWIRPRSDDPTGFLSEFLGLRGVESVEIDQWAGDSFQKLMRRCFPAG